MSKLIDELLKMMPTGPLTTLKAIISSKKPLTYSGIISLNKGRNPLNIKKDLSRFINNGMVTKITKAKITGRNKAKIIREHYKINKNNHLIRVLKKECCLELAQIKGSVV